MIHSFSLKNFYSFSEMQQVSFRVNSKAPTSDGFFETKSNSRLSKIAAIVGANASGKTNLLKGLPFFKWLVVDSFNSLPNELIPLKPFLFRKKTSDTEISVEFEIRGEKYQYGFILNFERIVKEELKVRTLTNKRNTYKTLFLRKWEQSNNSYQLTDGGFNLPSYFKNSIRANASIISTAIRFNHKLSQDISDFWSKVKTNVVERGWVGDFLLPTETKNLLSTMNFFSENEKLKISAENLLSRFDLGLSALKISKEKNDKDDSLNVQIEHSFGKKGNYHLPIIYESSGTKKIFVLLETILQVLENGGIAILDEFDVNLHPDIVSYLVEQFMFPETNPHNAQLVFSTHSHLILSKLKKYQIHIIEKNKNGESTVWRLDEMAGVRLDDNYYTKYVSGVYGGIPKID